MTTAGRLRENGSVVRERLLLQVKAPADSREPWDYVMLERRLSAEEAAPKPLAETGCPFLAP